MYFLFDTDLAGNFKRLNISFWTGVLCLALVAGKVMLSSDGSEQIGPFGLVLLFGGAALCYYLFLLDHIAFRLKKNGEPMGFRLTRMRPTRFPDWVHQNLHSCSRISRERSSLIAFFPM